MIYFTIHHTWQADRGPNDAPGVASSRWSQVRLVSDFRKQTSSLEHTRLLA